MTDKQKSRANMTVDKVNLDRCICDIDLVASGRKDCEEIRKHIRAIRRIFAGLPEEPTKFDVGDTIRPKGSKAEYTITSISGGCYHGKGWGLPISAEKDYELVESTEDVDACNIQYASIDGAIKAHAEDYSFNIESELFQQLTPEQQKMWRKEIERAVLSGAYSGLNLARDERYEENRQEESVSKYLQTEIEDYINRNFSEGSDGCLISDKNKSLGGVTYSEIGELARHFADWQKQQMMKTAIETEVVDDSFGQQVGEVPAIRYDVQPEDNLEIGDKVKLIIIKED